MNALKRRGVYRLLVGTGEWGLYRGIILGLHRDNGKSNGNYYIIGVV